MLVNLYRAKTPIAVISLPLFIGLLSVPIFIFPGESNAHFWNWQNDLDVFVKQNRLVHFLVTVVLVSLNAHQINNVYNRHTFYSKATFLPGMVYALLLFSLNQLNFSPNIVAHLFMILALGQFLKLRRQEGAKTVMFWGATLLGLATIFSSFSAALVILPWICLAIFRPFVWREWILVLLGFILPIFYYMAIMYMIKGGFDFKVAQPVEAKELKLDLFQAAALGMFALVYLASNYKYVMIMRSEINRFKKQSMVVFHFLWISAAIWFIGHQFFNHSYFCFLIPLAFVIGTPFLHAKRSWVVNLVVIIWLIISVVNIFFVR